MQDAIMRNIFSYHVHPSRRLADPTYPVILYPIQSPPLRVTYFNLLFAPKNWPKWQNDLKRKINRGGEDENLCR